MATSLKQMMEAANAAVPKITPDQAREMMAKGNTLVVDVRDAPEVEKSGKIAGAVNVSRGMLEFRADPDSPYHDKNFARDKTVILYCASGGRSALAGKALKDIGYGDVRLSSDAEAALTAYTWPGNIRELRNVLERALLLSESNVLRGEDFRFSRVAPPDARPDAQTILDNERRHIEQVLREENGRVDRAAQRLGIVRSALYKKIKKHGIVIPR